MSATAEIRAGVLEGRSLWSALSGESETSAPVGSLVVSGMLADQLARELGVGAGHGAVVVRESVVDAEAVVRVIAGDPSLEDEALVRAADAARIPVVLVQLWPQADWAPPFVLTPFVVECRAGEGFPVDEIAGRISEAVERAHLLASRIPVLQDTVARDVRRGAVVRAALLGGLGRGSRPALALAQARTVSRLRALDSGATAIDPRAAAGAAALLYASGFAFRTAARAAGRKLPAPLVNGAFAAAGTWAVARALDEFQARTSRR